MSLEVLSQFELIQTTQISMHGRNIFVMPSTSTHIPVDEPNIKILPIQIPKENIQWMSPILVC